MNLSREILLVNKNIRLIEAIYDLDPLPGQAGKLAERKLFKTLDPSIVIGDLVLVPTDTRYKGSVNKVVGVDVHLDDYDSGPDIRWIINKVDKTAYDAAVKMEQQAFVVMRDAERQAKEAELRKKLFEANPDLRRLSIANADFGAVGGAALAAPVQPPPSSPKDEFTRPVDYNRPF